MASSSKVKEDDDIGSILLAALLNQIDKAGGAPSRTDTLAEELKRDVSSSSTASAKQSSPWQLLDDNAARDLFPTWMEVDLENYRSLYLAAVTGDWESANEIFEQNPGAMTAKMSVFSRTPLHVAAMEGHTEFVEKLVERMPEEALAMQDVRGYTALHYAAVGGSLRAVKALVSKNPALTQIPEGNGWTPLLCAATVGGDVQKDVVWYLTLKTKDDEPTRPFTGPWAAQLIVMLTSAGFHDVSLYLIKEKGYSHLATVAYGRRTTLLSTLAEQPSDFYTGCGLPIWKKWIYSLLPVEVNYAPPQSVRNDVENPPVNAQHTNINSMQSATILPVVKWIKDQLWRATERHVPSIKRIRDAKLRHQWALELVEQVCIEVSKMNNVWIMQFLLNPSVLHLAASSGIVEIIRICVRFFPDVMWFPINDRHLVHVAIEHRRENIFRLFCEMTAHNKSKAVVLVEGEQSNILHLAAKLAPSHQLLSVSGSALQMQRELQWFKAVERLVHPEYKRMKNDRGKTPQQVFSEEHAELVEKGEKWMKDTANSSMVVSTLIATVVFAAAFTVPGGNNSNGIPMFLERTSFTVFAVSDALALFSSLTSLLMFLSILTSRYAEEDFLEALPKRLTIGLASLFLAIVSMMVAFGATISIVLSSRLKWVSIPVILLASFPVTLFAWLQVPLFIQMVQSTYGSNILCPQKG